MNDTRFLILLLTGVAGGELLVILALIWALDRSRVDAIRSIDRLLLLGKSSTPGEAIASYEKLSRIERIRGASEELLAQRKRGEGEVARKDPSAGWWGLRRKRPEPKANTGG